MLYFDRGKLRFAEAMTFVCFAVSYAALASLRAQLTVYDLYAVSGMLVGTATIGFLVLRRGELLTEAMERAVRSEMEAFADSVAVEYASKYDHLTGLYNHITFQEYIAVLIEPYFKQINDTFGHQQGDTVLRETARVLRASISTSFKSRIGNYRQ